MVATSTNADWRVELKAHSVAYNKELTWVAQRLLHFELQLYNLEKLRVAVNKIEEELDTGYKVRLSRLEKQTEALQRQVSRLDQRTELLQKQYAAASTTAASQPLSLPLSLSMSTTRSATSSTSTMPTLTPSIGASTTTTVPTPITRTMTITPPTTTTATATTTPFTNTTTPIPPPLRTVEPQQAAVQQDGSSSSRSSLGTSRDDGSSIPLVASPSGPADHSVVSSLSRIESSSSSSSSTSREKTISGTGGEARGKSELQQSVRSSSPTTSRHASGGGGTPRLPTGGEGNAGLSTSRGEGVFPLSVFAHCGIDLMPFAYRCTAVSRLHAFLKDDVNVTEGIDDLYQFECDDRKHWTCTVQIRGKPITGAVGKSLNKSEARERAASLAIEALKRHPDYFRYFVIRVPSLDNLNPIATLINFFASHSNFKDTLKFEYKDDESLEGGTTCIIKFREMTLAIETAESKKRARELAAKATLSRLLVTVKQLTLDYFFPSPSPSLVPSLSSSSTITTTTTTTTTLLSTKSS